MNTDASSENQTSLVADLSDSTPIEPQNVHNHGRVISLPLIYIDADERTTTDRVTSNLRVIDECNLQDLIQIALLISNPNNKTQFDICKELVHRLSKHSGEYTQLSTIIQWASDVASQMDVDVEYVDTASIPLSFDVIRNYNVDSKTGILTSADQVSISNIQLYSQLNGDKSKIQQIREQTNDTDFNRMQYCLAHFENHLMFKPGYLLSQTPKLINMGLVYLCLSSESAPVRGFSSNDIKGNLLSYIIDVVIRSRVIQAWQRDINTKILLKDLFKNYDTRNHIVQLSQMDTSRERAQFFLRLIQRKGELSKILNTDFFNKYMDLLAKHKLTIENQDFFTLGSEFIIEMVSLFSINKIDVESIYNDFITQNE